MEVGPSARPRSFAEAHATALHGEACFHAEEDQGTVLAVGTQFERQGGPPLAPAGPNHLTQNASWSACLGLLGEQGSEEVG